MKTAVRVAGISVLALAVGVACMQRSTRGPETSGGRDAWGGADRTIAEHARQLMDEGRTTFRSETFGSEAGWLLSRRSLRHPPGRGESLRHVHETRADPRGDARSHRVPELAVAAFTSRGRRPPPSAAPRVVHLTTADAICVTGSFTTRTGSC
jgi:hypothetical protein